MDVWVEFKNASRWQAEALFRNFFPCEDDDEDQKDLDKVQLDDKIQVQQLVRADDEEQLSSEDKKLKSRVYKPVDPLTMLKKEDNASSSPSTLWTSASSLLSSVSSTSSSSSSTLPPPPPLPKTHSGSPVSPSSTPVNKLDKSQFGATNTAYLPPPPDASIRKVKPLDMKTLAVLAKRFADGVPEEEFSVAGLQGCRSFLSFFVWKKKRG